MGRILGERQMISSYRTVGVRSANAEFFLKGYATSYCRMKMLPAVFVSVVVLTIVPVAAYYGRLGFSAVEITWFVFLSYRYTERQVSAVPSH